MELSTPSSSTISPFRLSLGLWVLGLVLTSVVEAQTIEGLSTTWVGEIAPGENGKLAVSWSGTAGAELTAWIDFDGDGVFGASELVVERRLLTEGIELLEVAVPVGVAVTELTQMRLQVRRKREMLGRQEVVQRVWGKDGPGECAWATGYHIQGLSSAVKASAIFDDGGGPALFVGGTFVAIGDMAVNYIAKWDGAAWQPLGAGLDGEVRALAVYDDGSGPALFVGGYFQTAGAVSARRIAKWNGTLWAPLGAGLGGRVEALTVFNDGSGPALYAGGAISEAGGMSVSNIAKWDGTTWESLDTGVTDEWGAAEVLALAPYDDGSGHSLYVGGEFTSAGGVNASHIAKWDGVTWAPLDAGVNSKVEALTVHDDGSGPALYAGGWFTTAGGLNVNHIAKWDGAAWAPLGTGMNYFVSALAEYDNGSGPALYAGGGFSNGVARWNGSVWLPLGSGMDSSVLTLTQYDDGGGPALYAGGWFMTAGGNVANYIAKWDGADWEAIPAGGQDGSGMNGEVRAMAVYDDGGGPALYAGGFFTTAGGVRANNIAKWDGGIWEPLSSGLSSVVMALAVYDDGGGPALYAGGAFRSAGGVSVNNIAKWDGATWTPLGQGVRGAVIALTVYDDGSGPALYAGGSFDTAGGLSASNIAKWDGARWAPLGTGTNNQVHALGVFDDGSGKDLYAVGCFDTAGGAGASRIAKWDGTAWTPVGSGLDSCVVSSLTVYDDGTGPALYVGGGFSVAGGASASKIAKWDGATWTALDTGVNSIVFTLSAYDDGSGPALYAGGSFTVAGGLSTNLIAKWDGVAWAPLGTGMRDWVVRTLTVYADGSGPSLYAGGDFQTAGGSISTNIAEWSCPMAPGPDSAITKTNNATQVVAGATSTYTIVASNPGPNDGLAATVTDTFPPDLTCSWASTPTGGARGHTAGSGTSLQDTLSLPVGSSVTYTVTCQVDSGATGELTNTATIFAAGDPNLGNNVASDTDSILQESDLAITLTNGISEVVAGATATYSLVVTNTGPSDAALATLTDVFPPELSACRWHAAADGAATGYYSGSGATLSDTLLLPAGSAVRYTITCAVANTPGATVSHTATVSSSTESNPANNTASDSDLIVARSNVKTLILTHFQRMQVEMGLSAADLEALLMRLATFADHASVAGLVIDVGHSTDLADLYALWDSDVALGGSNPGLANNVLFGCHGFPLPIGCPAEKQGLHDLVLGVLASHPELRYLMLLGDDRILPMARVRDFTSAPYTEKHYTPLGFLVPGLTATNTTVGQAAAHNRYLSDDPVTFHSPVKITELDDQVWFLPELAAGRLVETPEEMLHSLDVFLGQDGFLDLTALTPDHRVLVTGYDFLVDSAKKIRARWKNVFDEPQPHDPEDLVPVDGKLVSRTWDLSTTEDRRNALLDHLTGRSLGPYGIMSLNGHATHYEEGVPGTSFFDIQGLGTSLIDALDLTGCVIYAVGCHGGLPVAGNSATSADHPLDLPQTLLRRGVITYVANSGFGWGSNHSVGYSERMVEILTEELSQGGDVVIGDAVRASKKRYHNELPYYDPYDLKTSMQWTLFGFPMAVIHTDVTAAASSSGGAALKIDRHRLTSREGTPPYLIADVTHFDLTAEGLFTKYTTFGEVVPTGVAGCPTPPPGEAAGCYYTLNQLAFGKADLPVEPFLLEDSRLPAASQHGVLWRGGHYEEETGWTPVFSQLVSNAGLLPLPASLPRKTWIRPTSGTRPGGALANQSNCRPTDTEINSLVASVGELVFDEQLEPTIHRLHREVDIELFYYNNTVDGSGNCDRTGPEFGDGPYHSIAGGAVHWAVPATDEGGVWRVVIVYDDEVNDRWVPLELTYNAASDRWTGQLIFPAGMSELTYFLQAVDNRGNVSWAEFVPPEPPATGIDSHLPLPLTAFNEDGTIFADGFESGDCSAWSSCQ